jgi:hypothetical protein
MSEQDPYAGREQSGIKHFILRKYLDAAHAKPAE